MKKDPQAILQTLGREAVLLPIREGSKATMVKGWPEKAFEDTQTSSYQNLLEGASAIAVSLGAPSGGLCSIDFDCEEAMRVFLRVNPFLKETLRTKGRRGANLWVTIYDEKIPPMTHLKDALGEPVGEWRSDRSYTIIAGKHPNGMSYETVVAAKPLEIPFEEIKWPDGWGNLPTLAQEKPKLRTVAKVERPITTKPKAHIQNDFDYLKEVYLIHDAWEDLGLPGEPSESCRSPFRDDLNPSFSVFDA